MKPDSSLGMSDGRDVWQYGIEAWRNFLPGTRFKLNGNVRRYIDDEDDLNRVTIRCEVRQPLFRNFGSLIHGEGIRQAQSRLRKVRRLYEQQKVDLVVEVVRTYEEIIRLQRQIISDEQFFDRTEKLFRLTQARERQGHTTRVDTLRVELQRGQALERLENNRERLYSTQRNLAELLGVPPEHSFSLEPPPKLEMDLPELDEAVGIALSNRLDYAQLLDDCRDSSRAVRIAERSLYPELEWVTSYERYGESEDLSDAWGLEDDSWFVGISGDTDFNRLEERTALGTARLDRRSVEESIRIKEWTIAREVQQGMAAYRRAQADVKIATRNYRLAESRAKLARRMFEIGRGDNFSATDAEQAYIQAENRMLTAREEAALSGYRMLRLLGTLIETPAHLKPAGRALLLSGI
jgi:outer membrane protein TolC